MIAAKPIFLDTVVLSNFGPSHSLDVLTVTLERPATVPQVRCELERGALEGYAFTRRALDAPGAGIAVVEPPETSLERFEEDLDAGEAAVLAVANERGGVAATDDRPARTLAADEDIPVSGLIGILLHAIESDEMTAQGADAWIER